MIGLDTKYQFWLFSGFDYKGMEDSLTAMAAKGWELKSIGGLLWKYKRSKPVRKKFVVCFSNDGSDEIICGEKGWQKVMTWKQMQIFSAEEDVAAPLAIDQAVRIEGVCHAMEKTFIPAWIIGFAAMIILALYNGTKYFTNSPYCDEGTLWAFIVALWGAFVTGFVLFGYKIWIKKSRTNITNEVHCISFRWYRNIQNISVVGFLILAAGCLVSTVIL